VLSANGQAIPASAPGFELNVTHPLVRYMDALKEPEPFSELALLLYDQASLADEGQVANGAEFARRLNKLLVRLVEPRP
jgi:molecular chaperone HtpG